MRIGDSVPENRGSIFRIGDFGLELEIFASKTSKFDESSIFCVFQLQHQFAKYMRHADEHREVGNSAEAADRLALEHAEYRADAVVGFGNNRSIIGQSISNR